MSQYGTTIPQGGGGSVVEKLTGNSGGAVSPTLGNINIVGASGVVVTGNPATHTLTITAPGFDVYPYTSVNSGMSPYTVLSTDYYISVDCSGGDVTIKLPNSPTQYQTWVVKDKIGPSALHDIFVTTVGGIVTIDGNTTYEIMGDFDSVNVLFNGVSYEIF